VAGGLTANTAITDSVTYATGGITLTGQSAALNSVWRVRAFGTFTAASSATARNAEVVCYWGTTALAAITPAVLINTAQTTPWDLEFIITGSSTTALWVVGQFNNQLTAVLATGIPLKTLATPGSTTVTGGAQTLDLRFAMSALASGDAWSVQSVTMERLQ
jgi:hypothetical protein